MSICVGRTVNQKLVNHSLSATYFLTYCPVRPSALRTATKFLHSCLSCAFLSMTPQVQFRMFSLVSTVRQVVFGCPRFLLPSGVQWTAVFGIEFRSILSTWPIQLKRIFGDLLFTNSYRVRETFGVFYRANKPWNVQKTKRVSIWRDQPLAVKRAKNLAVGRKKC